LDLKVTANPKRPGAIKEQGLPMASNLSIGVGCILLACGVVSSTGADRFVSLAGGHVSPFISWADAATNIQAAIDAATDGDTVWVTNGVYAEGGKVMSGNLTNRVALDKPLAVRSVNGPYFTVIRGSGTTNGPTGVRCAWVTNGATLDGFTLTGGAARTSGEDAYGGGVFCVSTNATVMNCLVVSNVAGSFGSRAVYGGTIVNSAIIGNSSSSGYSVADANLINCTVVSNSPYGTYQCRHTNTIIYYNGGANYSGASVL
jgi:hypothetical protein